MSAGPAVTVREHVLLELARRDKSEVEDTFRAITEAAAVVLDVARVSIWELVGGDGVELDGDARIVCKDLYLQAERRHVSFMPIHGRDFPAYLRAIHERRTIAADDAQRDPRTCEFTDFYLKPLEIASMMDVPIWHRGKVYGVLCFEHVGAIRRWRPEEQAFAVNMTDIASAALAAGALVAMKRRSEAVLEALAEGVTVLDPAGDVIHQNRAARRLLAQNGLTSWEEMRSSVDLVDAADRLVARDDWPLRRALRREVIEDEIYGLIFKRTGDRRYVRVTCSPIVEHGTIPCVVMVMVDATEEMFVERLKRELLAGVAHELKTPLAIAKGYAQQLEASPQVPADRRRTLAEIVKACDRMDHLSETLLDLASIILGRLRLTRERVDLADLALGVVRRAERGARVRRFQLKTRVRIPVIVDSARMTQAIRQIVDNALAYAPSGPIEIDLSVEHDKATMSVTDHGMGIPRSAQASIFGLFFKAHAGTEGDRGGLGVGLYLAREIARRHGGDLRFASVEGKGSTFYLSLPVAEPAR